MSTRRTVAIVLAAGEGTRMQSSRPKPLHKLCGRPMALHVVDALEGLPIDCTCMVVGHGASTVTAELASQIPVRMNVVFAQQPEQRGTGDATLAGLGEIPEDLATDEDNTDVIVLNGDTPLLRSATVAALLGVHRQMESAATVLTAHMENPTGYGRIVRGRGDKVIRIVEQADASDDEQAIKEVSVGIYVFRQSVLAPALRRLEPANAQGEYYLPDVVEVLAEAGYPVGSMIMTDPTEASGVNDRVQLAAAESKMRERINLRWMNAGVTLLDPARTVIEATVELAPDVTVFPDSWLQGNTVVGRGAKIGPSTRLMDTGVGEGAIVEQTVAHEAAIGEESHVGPFAVLEPGSRVEPGQDTGPFFHGLK